MIAAILAIVCCVAIMSFLIVAHISKQLGDLQKDREQATRNLQSALETINNNVIMVSRNQAVLHGAMAQFMPPTDRPAVH